jgi:hypothetical protein
MCMQTSGVRGLSRYHWEGEAVVFDAIVPSSRPVVGGKNAYEPGSRGASVPAVTSAL